MKTTAGDDALIAPEPDEPLAGAPAAGETASKTSAWRVLRNRDYSLLFWGQLISSAGTQIQVVAVALQVYQLTNSAVALGLIGLMQAIPRLIFSLIGGVTADIVDRRKLLFGVNAIMAALSAVLAVTTQLNVINIVLIYAVVLISAAVSSFEFPTRQAMIPMLVPREQMRDAISVSMVAMQLTFVVGSAAGGFVLAAVGIANTYWLDVISYIAVLAALGIMVVPRVPAEKRPRSGVAAMVEGWAFLRAHPVIFGVLSLDFIATFFGSPRALLPIYALNILNVGKEGLGVLYAATSIGAVALTPLTGRISRVYHQGRGVSLAIVGWGLCIIVFGLLGGPFWLSVLMLAGAGAADMISMILRGLIVQITTPDEFRGRVGAVNAMFVIGGPMLGQFESGVVAGVTSSVVFSVVSGGVACILGTLLVLALVPRLWRVHVE